MIRIEALADALASLNDWTNPDADAYRLRNPGMLRAFTLRHEMDEQGRRVFPSLVDGYQALIYDLRKKCEGGSRSKLKPTSVLRELLVRGYSHSPSAEEYVLCFLQKALAPVAVDSATPLKFFLEG